MEETPTPQKARYVIQLPVRIWHWSIVICIATLTVTGYYIGYPWHSIQGHPTYLFLMGYMRIVHFSAGFILAIGIFLRLIYAFFGNHYSRQIFVIPIWKKSWWQELMGDFRWYLFIDKTPHVHYDHNPLAQVGMFACVFLIFFMTFTGMGMFVMSSDNPWLVHTFYWVVDVAYWAGGNGIDLHNWHRLGMLFILAFIIIHLYMVIREEIMGNTTLVSGMFSGFKLVRAIKTKKDAK